MFFLPTLCTPSADGAITNVEAKGVVENSRLVREAAQNGTLGQLLKGRRLALVTDFGSAEPSAMREEEHVFTRAATEMGALVSRLRPGLSNASPAQEVQNTARMLGQLYDALECQGMDLRLVQQIALYAGVPVFQGLASTEHRTAVLAHQMALQPGTEAADAPRTRVVQAVLLGTMA